MKLDGRKVVVFDGVTGPHQLGPLEAGDGMNKFHLNVIWQARRETIDIEFLGMSPFGPEKYLMRRFINEFDYLILDGWTISGSGPLDLPGIEGRSVEVFANYLMGLRRRVGDPTRHL